MSPDPYQNDWDTPPDGDFVRYLERLGAATPAPAPATPPATTQTAKAPPNLPSTSDVESVVSMLHKARTVVLWLTIAHFLMWLILSKGSLPFLLFMAALWWGLDQVLQAIAQRGTARQNTGLTALVTALARLQDERRLRQSPRQHHHESSHQK